MLRLRRMGERCQNHNTNAKIKMQNDNAKLKIIAKRYLNFDFCTLHFEFLNGFGVIEIIIVVAIVAGSFLAFLQTESLAIRLLRNEKENLEAAFLAQESLEVARAVRDESWTNNIVPLANGPFYYPMIESGKWKLVSTDPGPVNGKYTRYVIFEEVRRDAQDRISATGTIDPGTRKITSRVLWNQGTKIKEVVAYITNFQESLSGPKEAKIVSFEDAPTDSNLNLFHSNNLGDGDPVQSFTTPASSTQVTRVDLFLKRATTTPADIFLEIRKSPTGVVLKISGIISSATILGSTLNWVAFRFPAYVELATSTVYHLRLRSAPSSTDALSGSVGPIHWGHKQSSPSPYLGGEARRYVGRLSNPNDTGELLDQYDFGFKVYALQ